MSKKTIPHPYTERQAFERLMLLIATLVQHPGVGCPEPDSPQFHSIGHHNALQEVQTRLQEVARSCGVELPDYAISTLRKDMETLRRYGILDRRMYRWGYYLGTGAMRQDEFQVAFDALASQAKYQGDPQARQIHRTLTKRLRGLDLELNGQFFYPVRQQMNRAIIYTDLEEMMALGDNQDNLFHKWDAIVEAISNAQAIEISRGSDPYRRGYIGRLQVWPLQLIYHDIAWYLIYEYCDDGHLAVGRVNRFKNYCKILTSHRSLDAQYGSLHNAHKLIENGWGLYLGEPAQQQAELQCQLEFVTVKVRFFPPVLTFIEEGKRRHPSQKIKVYKDDTTAKPKYLDYTVKLPPRSLNEFSLWVFRYMDNAQVLSPPRLVEKHSSAAQALVSRYCD